jgi:hypothetical protein
MAFYRVNEILYLVLYAVDLDIDFIFKTVYPLVLVLLHLAHTVLYPGEKLLNVLQFQRLFWLWFHKGFRQFGH